MISLVAFWVWTGGLSPAYAKNRANGTGVFWSAMESIIWPGGVGRYVAKRFYDLW